MYECVNFQEGNVNIFQTPLPHSKHTFGSLANDSSSKTEQETNEHTSSVFDDNACGEPLVGQRLILNFTPNEETDNEYVQKKCSAFWDFIKSVPEIQGLMVYPTKKDVKSSHGTSDTSLCTLEEEESEIPEKTAISILQVLDEKGISAQIFGAKMPQTTCSLGSREYKELEEPPHPPQPKTKKNLGYGWYMPCPGRKGPPCPFPCGECCHMDKPTPLKTMVRKMQSWDKEHPKSMEPPGHPPSLQHCILQRKKYPDNIIN